MATAVRVEQGEIHVPENHALISYEDALQVLSHDETFKSTVYAMNTLLIEKGIYSAEEFRFQFRQAAQKIVKSKARRA